MNAEFTQGTWQQIVCQPGNMLTIVGPDREYVCSLLGNSDDRKQANARLIVAAPRLLLALKGAMRTVRMHHGNDCKCIECEFANTVIKDAT